MKHHGSDEPKGQKLYLTVYLAQHQFYENCVVMNLKTTILSELITD